jgi:hypothetical protein
MTLPRSNLCPEICSKYRSVSLVDLNVTVGPKMYVADLNLSLLAAHVGNFIFFNYTLGHFL